MDERELMEQAVELARGTRPHPNPRVGALVVDRGGRVVGRGAHRGPGHPHAEMLALREAGERAAGGTLIVTLEPCAHRGMTPPCSRAVVEAGIARVVLGTIDPDPRVSGRGMETLRSAGLEVRAGVAGELAESLDPGYLHHRRTGRPRVTLKAAMTLDGQVAAADGSSRWITSSEGRRDAHRLRAGSDAVMVGAGTVLADDPRLTVRLEGFEGPDPLAVVVAGRRPLPPDRRVFERKAVVLAPRPVDLPAEVVVTGRDGRVDLGKALGELGRRGVVDLLVEGGPGLTASLLAEGLVDRAVLYYGPLLAGGSGLSLAGGTFPTLASARAVEVVDVRRVGPDIRVEVRIGGR